MVVIPRYESTLSSAPINSGRRLTTGLSGANSLVNFGQQLSNDLNVYATQKIEIAARQRDREIENMSLLSASENKLFIDNKVKEYESRVDYKTFRTDYEKSVEKHIKDIKKKHFTVDNVFDEIAFKRYEPLMYADLVEGSVKVNTVYTQKFNYETITVHNQSVEDYYDKINQLNSINAIRGHYKFFNTNVMDSAFNNNIFEPDGLNTQNQKIIDETNKKLILLQTGGGKMPTRKNINGETVIDYRQAALVLSQEDFEYVDIDGNVIKSQDSLVQSVLENYESRATAQENNDKVAKELFQNKNNNKFNTDILNMRTDGKIDDNFPDAVRDAVNKEQISGDAGKNLLDSYNTFLEEKIEGKVESWETEEGEKYEDYVNLLLFNGEIDSQSEWDNLIVAAVASGLLENDITKINNKKNLYDENKQARAEANKNAIESAENLIKRSFGVDDTTRLVFRQQGVQEGFEVVKNANPNELISYRAINNLNELVIAGLKKNIPIQEMLSDRTSSNYIIEDLITLYKTDLNNLKETEFANLATGQIQGFFNSENNNLESIKIDPNAWISTRGRNVPLKLENEGPEDYVTRLQEYFKSTDFGGKSAISEGPDNSVDLLMGLGGANDEESFGFDFEDQEMSNE